MKVFKFGGASVKDADAIINVGRILERYPDDRIVLIVSAMGKSTNVLESIIDANNETERNEHIEYLKQYHQKCCNELFGEDQLIMAEIDRLIEELKMTLKTHDPKRVNHFYDQVICFGELLSSTILNHYLKSIDLSTNFMDARRAIITDDTHMAARVYWDKTVDTINSLVHNEFKDYRIIITQGFIAGSEDGVTTTLGREGSDFSGAIFAYALDVGDYYVWKEVDGVYNADPNEFVEAKKLESISYEEAIEMTYYGSKVIHPRTIQPLKRKSIKLHVRSFKLPEKDGTVIINIGLEIYPCIVIIGRNQKHIELTTRDFSFISEKHFSLIFRLLEKLAIKVNVMQNTAVSMRLCLSDPRNRLGEFEELLEDEFIIDTIQDLTLLTFRHIDKIHLRPISSRIKKPLMEEHSRHTTQLLFSMDDELESNFMMDYISFLLKTTIN